jgi:hypothetical protein
VSRATAFPDRDGPGSGSAAFLPALLAAFFTTLFRALACLVHPFAVAGGGTRHLLVAASVLGGHVARAGGDLRVAARLLGGTGVVTRGDLRVARVLGGMPALADGDLGVAAGLLGGARVVASGALRVPAGLLSGTVVVARGDFRVTARLLGRKPAVARGEFRVAAGLLAGAGVVARGGLGVAGRGLGVAPGVGVRALAGLLGVVLGALGVLARVLGVLARFGGGALIGRGGGRGHLRDQRRGRGGERQGKHPVGLHGSLSRVGTSMDATPPGDVFSTVQCAGGVRWRFPILLIISP